MESAPVIEIESGRISGRERFGVLEYLGVPYAAPLAVDRRFAAPQAPEPWAGVRPCDEPGPAVFQVGTAGHIGRDALSHRPQGADGLSLNIRTRDLAPGKPVLVWFHGGGLFAGSNAEPQLSTRAFAVDGVVEVIANYRLGLYGYLDLGDGGNPNRGMLDQIAALQWVRRNIAAFGGDPDRVTIGGHSAGGFACAELLASPAATGLFSRVLLGSGAASARHDAATAAAVRGIVFDALGVSDASELSGRSDAELLTAQQALIEECYVYMPARFEQASILGLPFEHTIDGATVVDDVPRALAGGAAAGIPILVSTTTGESRAHVSQFPDDLTDAQASAAYDGMVRPLGVTGEQTVRAYRERMPEVSAKGLLAALNADLRFTLDSVRVALAQTGRGPAYRVVLGETDRGFGGLTPHGGIQGHVWRAPHGMPQPELKPQHRPFNAETAEFMHSAVVSFIESGAPVSRTAAGEYAWPEAGSLAPEEVLRVRPDGFGVSREASWDRLRWWGDRLDRSTVTAR